MKTVKKTAIKGIIIPNDYQWIYDFFGMTATSPGKLQKDLNDAAGDDVIVEVNSPGGYVSSGSELYNIMRTYNGRLTIDVVGQAASAASVAAMARHNRIAPTASLMIHNVSVDGVSGDYHEMDKASSMLQELTKTMANAYVIKTGMSRNKILEMMDNETTIEANDAVKQGFIDELIPQFDESQLAGIALNAECKVLPEELIQRIKETVKHQPEGADLTEAKIRLLELEGYASMLS